MNQGKPIHIHNTWDCSHAACGGYLDVIGFRNFGEDGTVKIVPTKVTCSNCIDCPALYCFSRYDNACKACSKIIRKVNFTHYYFYKFDIIYRVNCYQDIKQKYGFMLIA